MSLGNQRTSLALSAAQRSNMAAYDALPPVLRQWLAEAAMPWSPLSAKRAWRRAMRKALWRPKIALRIMDQIEADRLAQDRLILDRELAMSQIEVPRGASQSKARRPNDPSRAKAR